MPGSFFAAATRASTDLIGELVATTRIDGLNAVPGALFAVQNGVRPQRVMRFTLDASGTRVTAGEPIESGTARLGEPTHGVVADGAYVFLAGTGWDRVGADQRLVSKPDAPRPALLSVPLGGGRPGGLPKRR